MRMQSRDKLVCLQRNNRPKGDERDLYWELVEWTRRAITNASGKTRAQRAKT